MVKKALLAAILALICCGNPCQAAEILEIPGTGACEVLLRDLAAAFNTENTGMEVRIPPSIGSVGGLRVVVAGEHQLARVALPAGEREPEAGLQFLAFARDAVIFGLGANVTMPSLTEPQMRAILHGKISN